MTENAKLKPDVELIDRVANTMDMREEREPSPLCTFGPPVERKRHWILIFEDADVGNMHFDDETEAMAAFDKHTDRWNCTLFVTASALRDELAAKIKPRCSACGSTMTDEELPQPAPDGRRLRHALAESIRLQSHYAMLLNQHDGGTRMQFESIEAWLVRLAETHLADSPK